MKNEDLIEKLKDYVLKLEFNLRVAPLEKLIYGTVTIVLVAVFGALVALVVKK